MEEAFVMTRLSEFQPASRSRRVWLWWLAAALFLPSSASAHVKWFTDYSFSDAPLSMESVFSGQFFLLLGLSVLVIGTLTLLEEPLMKVRWVAAVDAWFASRADWVLPVMRIGTGVA